MTLDFSPVNRGAFDSEIVKKSVKQLYDEEAFNKTGKIDIKTLMKISQYKGGENGEIFRQIVEEE